MHRHYVQLVEDFQALYAKLVYKYSQLLDNIINQFVFLSNIYSLVWQTTNINIYRTNSLLNMVEIIPYIIKHSFNVTVQGFLVYSCIENFNNPLHNQLSYL